MNGWFHAVIEPMTAAMLLFGGLLAGYRIPALRKTLGSREKAQKKASGFGAAMTALSGTIGTGNIIGVAVAISVGGPGAIFWMCISALVGIPLKYAEIVLACRHRICLPSGNLGGPMYYLERYFGRAAGCIFSVLCLLTGLGVGNLAQSGAVGVMLQSVLPDTQNRYGWILAVALLFGFCLYASMCGGAKRVQSITSILTPCMAVGYLLGCSCILFRYADRIPMAMTAIWHNAWGLRSVGGAAVGMAVKTGVMRGLFTNESGLGSAPIAHGCSGETAEVAGRWGIFEVFFDTVVMCSITGLTLLVSGVPVMDGYTMTARAFETAFGVGGKIFLTAALWLFALAAAIGWGFYAEQSLFYLTARKTWIFPVLFAFLAAIGFFFPQDIVLRYTDLTNACLLLYHAGAVCIILCTLYDSKRN